MAHGCLKIRRHNGISTASPKVQCAVEEAVFLLFTKPYAAKVEGT